MGGFAVAEDAMTERRGQAILTTDIDLSFVPKPVDRVSERQLGDELVLYDPEREAVFVLDPIGSVIWRCLDGEVSLGELSEDIVEVLKAPSEEVPRDVVELARRLGAAGLLVGVTAPPGRNRVAGAFEVGEELPPFSFPDMTGRNIDLTKLAGGRVLLVNWNPGCGFCRGIAPELAGLAPALAQRDVELVLLSTGDPDENRALFDETGLHVPTLLQNEDDGDEVDEDEEVTALPTPFPGMGTPTAYLVDPDGRVAAPLAVGAVEVPKLARRAAGVDETEEELPAGAKYLELSAGGLCGPGAGGGKRTPMWAPTGAYRIGEYYVGVRGDSPRTEALLKRFLASSRLGDGTRVPDDYSVILGDGTTTARGLCLVLQGGSIVIRTRSPRRALLGVAAYLSSHLPIQPDGLVRTTNVAVLIDDRALILPSEVRVWRDRLQPRLAKIGGRLVDRPFATIDPDRLELVVPEPGLPLDLSAIDELAEPPPRRSEPPMVQPGRYPLARWTVWHSGEDPPLRPAQVVTKALSSCLVRSTEFDLVLDELSGLRSGGFLVPFQFMTLDELIDRVSAAVAGG